MEDKKSFGEYVAKRRKELGLTQKNFADKLFVSESAVSKWERGLSYPDITLIRDICTVLEINEHELLTASEDVEQRNIEKQAKKFQKIVKTYSWTFYLAYGLSLLACFICNLAIQHTLSWFFIVLTAEMVAFTLTSLPALLEKNKGVITLGAFFLTLCLLLFVCCVYTGGDWFFVAFISILFGLTVVFLPFVLRALPLPEKIYQHKTLICFAADTVLLFPLLGVTLNYTGNGDLFTGMACQITLYSLILPWALMAVIRYTRLNAMFKAAACSALSGVYIFLMNSVFNVIIDHKPFEITPWNFADWSIDYVNGNVMMLILLTCLGVALLFAVGGILISVNEHKQKD